MGASSTPRTTFAGNLSDHEILNKIHMSKTIDLSEYPRRYVGNAASPFRYPGGKGFLASFLAERLSRRFSDTQPNFAEPFCGGAGSAANLLVDGYVQALYLNDADPRIYSAWRAMIFETERFIDALESVDVDLTSWNQCLEKLYSRPMGEYDFELGFAAFFVNRTSRSGVILGSGPIGGFSQSGKWKIGARFNKNALSRRIKRLAQYKDRIEISCQDGLDFCNFLQRRGLLKRTFLFLDPPYVRAGRKLYFDGMHLEKHNALARWLKSDAAPHWLLTYDDHPVIRDNFSELEQYSIAVKYSLAKKRCENELLFMSAHSN